ncbi:MAG: hypothetical protein ACR2I8_10460 [Steroidobacteraceae bacterium]
MTLADRAALALALLAGGCAVAESLSREMPLIACFSALAALVLAGAQLLCGRRRRAGARLWLQRHEDGRLEVRAGPGPAVAATLGPGTRMVGPSVFLDLRYGGHGYRRWLTPFDVPAADLRRWSVVLPSSGRAACS